MAGKTALRQVLTAAGFPGRVTTKELFSMPVSKVRKTKENGRQRGDWVEKKKERRVGSRAAVEETRGFDSPAVCLDRMAVGTPSRREALRISSPKPGKSLWQTFSMASGVTSRGAGPVPPVVTIRAHPLSPASLVKVDSMT